MDQNPYRAPTTTDTAADTAVIRVEGKHLIVTSGAVLPPYCVKTNVAVQEDDIRPKRLSWCPPFISLLILLSGLLLIVVYFIARKHCTIAFGLSPAVRQRYRNRRILTIVVIIVLFFALPVIAVFDSTPAIFAGLVLLMVAIISLFVANSPLTITKYRKGEFWISGCSKEFLSRVQE